MESTQAPPNSETQRIRLPLCVSLAVVLISLIWIGYGWFEYGFWIDGGPGGGFFPVVAGAAAALLGLLEVVRAAGKRGRPLQWRSLLPLAAMAATIAAVPLLGMIVSVILFLSLWLVVVERQRWSKALAVGAGTGLIIHLLFGVWLRVAFEKGILLRHIL